MSSINFSLRTFTKRLASFKTGDHCGRGRRPTFRSASNSTLVISLSISLSVCRSSFLSWMYLAEVMRLVILCWVHSSCSLVKNSSDLTSFVDWMVWCGADTIGSWIPNNCLLLKSRIIPL